MLKLQKVQIQFSSPLLTKGEAQDIPMNLSQSSLKYLSWAANSISALSCYTTLTIAHFSLPVDCPLWLLFSNFRKAVFVCQGDQKPATWPWSLTWNGSYNPFQKTVENPDMWLMSFDLQTARLAGVIGCYHCTWWLTADSKKLLQYIQSTNQCQVWSLS